MAESNEKIADTTPEVEKVESTPTDVAESTPASGPAAEEPKVDEPTAEVTERKRVQFLWEFTSFACAVVLRFLNRSCR